MPVTMESCCNPTSAPRTSGGAISALYIGTIIESEPTPIPIFSLSESDYKITDRKPRTSDETATEDRRVAARSHGGGLNNDANNEDGDVDENRILPRQNLCQE